MTRKFVVAVLLSVLSFAAYSAPIHAQPQDPDTQIDDPLEPFNQAMFTFNLKVDEYVLRPVATAYDSVLPDAAQRGVRRFFKNLGIAERLANNLLQGKIDGAGREVGRFLVNTTVGCVGFLDVADAAFGWKESPEDFGQTLAVYGVANGPYLVLPFYGPSTARDATGLAVNGALNPMNYLLSTIEVVAIKGGVAMANSVNNRSINLELFQDVDRYSLDLYGAVQDAYMQSREKAIEE